MLPQLHPAGGRHRKKLEEAARHFARGEIKDEEEHGRKEAHAQDSLDEQFAALNVQPDAPVDITEALQPLYLWPENHEAWLLFMAAQTQWRHIVAGKAVLCTGLDYGGVQAVIGQRRRWRQRRRHLFAAVQIMEGACLAEWNERAAQEPR